MERQLDEITEGKEATIAGVINDLKEKGYKIKEVTGGANTIKGIAVSEENVTIERNTEKTMTYTLIYSEENTIRYFVEVQGKDYEILFNNGNITVNTEETNVGEISKKPEVTVTSSDSTIIEANKTEEGKIKLIAKDKIGDVEITVKEINSNITKIFIAKIIVPATTFSVEPTTIRIQKGSYIEIIAKKEPEDSTDKIMYSVSDFNIIDVNEDGKVYGKMAGTCEIIVSCGEFDVIVPVEVENKVIQITSNQLVNYGVTGKRVVGNDPGGWGNGFLTYIKCQGTSQHVRYQVDLKKLREQIGDFDKVTGTVKLYTAMAANCEIKLSIFESINDVDVKPALKEMSVMKEVWTRFRFEYGI